MSRNLLIALAGAAVGSALTFGAGEKILCGRGYHFVWTAGNKHGFYMRCLLCKTELELRNSDASGDN